MEERFGKLPGRPRRPNRRKGIHWEAIDVVLCTLYPLSSLGEMTEPQEEMTGWYNEGG